MINFYYNGVVFVFFLDGVYVEPDVAGMGEAFGFSRKFFIQEKPFFSASSEDEVSS
jgi:hypothetical protein